MTRRAARTAAALVALLLLPLVAPGPLASDADAQEIGPPPGQDAQGPDADDAGGARVVLLDVTPTVASGAELTFRVLVEHAGARDAARWERVEVVAELHGPLGSRSALRVALAGGAVPPVAQRTVVEVDAVPLAPGGVVRVDGSMPMSGPGLGAADAAVHPLRLTVLADGEAVARLATAVVRDLAEPRVTLASTLVWPLAAPPARDADGATAATLDPLTVPGGRLDTLVAALAPLAAPDAPEELARLARGVGLVAPAHLVEDLARRAGDAGVAPFADTDEDPPVEPADPDAQADERAARAALLLQRIRGTARALPGPPLASPYADADLARLLASGAGLQPLAARAALEGSGRVAQLLGVGAAPVVVLGPQVVPAMLDLIPHPTVVLPYAALEAPDLALDEPLGEPVRTLRSPAGRTVTALVGDPFLAGALSASSRTSPGDPVLAAQDVLARTAMVHLEAPGRAGRALVLLPEDGFDPDPRFAAELLRRLAVAPWLTHVPADLLAVTASASDPAEPARLSGAPVEPLSPRLVNALTTTTLGLDLLAGAVDLDAGQVVDLVPVGPRDLADAGDELLRAASRSFATDIERAVSILAGVRAGVDGAFGTIALRFDDVTLTDRSGTLPITLTHAGGVPIRVRLEVDGPAALTWTDGRVREVALGPDQEHTLEIAVRSGASGRFPVSVRVTDPSGTRLLAVAVVGLLATAAAGPALIAIAGLVVLLVVFGALRQRRRGLAWRTATAREVR